MNYAPQVMATAFPLRTIYADLNNYRNAYLYHSWHWYRRWL